MTVDLYAAYPASLMAHDNSLFVRQVILPHLACPKDAPILETGAGCGDVVGILARLGFSNVRGVDSSPAQVAKAQSKGIAIELADGETALRQTAPDSLGAVLALDVLEHLTLEQQLEWARLARSRLQPRGVALVRVPNGAGLFGGAVRWGDLTHLSAFTVASLEQLGTTAGFERTSVEPVRPIAHGLTSALRAGAWLALESCVRVASAVESGSLQGEFTRNLFCAFEKAR